MGPDLRIAMPQIGSPRLGPPILNPQAPTAIPQVAPTIPSAPVTYPGRTVAQHVQIQGAPNGCVGCPSLADVAPLGWWGKMPSWAKIVGGVAVGGLTIGLIVYLVRRYS